MAFAKSMRSFAPAIMSILFAAMIASGAAPEGSGLKLVITVEQQTLTAPFPARIALHLHNSGSEALWLYRPVSASKPGTDENGTNGSRDALGRAAPSIEGSTVAVRVGGADNSAMAVDQGVFFDTVGMPRPKLIRLAPGEDDEIKTVARILPAQVGIGEAVQTIWGQYKIVVTYAAKYSNGDDLNRILGVMLWQGAVESNTVVVDLQPPSATGTITGTVVNPANLPLDRILVSLSDQQEQLMNQVTTNLQGKYSFSELPPGTYWVTIRRKDASEDNAIFRHVTLTAGEPPGTVDFLLKTEEKFEPKQVLHKPVLIRVVDGSDAPLANVGLDITWSNGTVLDSVKGATASDGVVPVEVIPGANYVTLKRRGCPKDDERLNVAEGPGIDGFKMMFDCTKK
jgi:Carboxypeptidase regulatory-like domain